MVSALRALLRVGGLVVGLCLGLVLVDSGAHSAQQGDRLAQISKSRLMRVCIWPDYYAISFRNPQDGKLTGAGIDLAQELAREMQVVVEFHDSTLAAFQEDLVAGRCDMAMLAVTAERLRNVDFTKPHLQSGLYAISTVGNSLVNSWDDLDRPGHVIAVQAGTLAEQVMRGHLKDAKALSVRAPLKREDEVLSGRADALIADYPYAKSLQYRNDWAAIISPPQRFGMSEYAYAVPKSQAGWLARIDRFVADIKADGRLARIAAQHGLSDMVMTQAHLAK